MNSKVSMGLMLVLLIVGMLTLTFNIQPVKGWAGTVYIRADGAVDPPDAPIASVDNVTYTLADSIFGSIVVKRDDIVIDGAGYSLQGPGASTGIDLAERTNVTVRNTHIKNFLYGIWLFSSFGNIIIGNNITNNYYYGIGLYFSSGNRFYHNNFIDNNYQVIIDPSVFANVWDDGYPSGGNYWSNYTGVDVLNGSFQNETGSDGVGDTSYFIDVNNQDRYPLMGPFTTFDAGTWNDVTYNVDVVSNSTISDFYFSPDEKPFIRFNVTGFDGTTGLCRVTIPKELLWVDSPGQWAVLVGDGPVIPTVIEDANYSYLYFTYSHSTKSAKITGIHAVPEFPSTLMLPLLMTITMLASILVKRREARTLH